MWPERERRKSARAVSDFPVTYYYCDRQGEPLPGYGREVHRLGVARNVGQSGLLLAGHLPPREIVRRLEREEAFVSVAFGVNQPGDVFGLCRLAWLKPLGKGPGGKADCAMGLEFVALEEEVRQVLIEHSRRLKPQKP